MKKIAFIIIALFCIYSTVFAQFEDEVESIAKWKGTKKIDFVEKKLITDSSGFQFYVFKYSYKKKNRRKYRKTTGIYDGFYYGAATLEGKKITKLCLSRESDTKSVFKYVKTHNVLYWHEYPGIVYTLSGKELCHGFRNFQNNGIINSIDTAQIYYLTGSGVYLNDKIIVPFDKEYQFIKCIDECYVAKYYYYSGYPSKRNYSYNIYTNDGVVLGKNIKKYEVLDGNLIFSDHGVTYNKNGKVTNGIIDSYLSIKKIPKPFVSVYYITKSNKGNYGLICTDKIVKEIIAPVYNDIEFIKGRALIRVKNNFGQYGVYNGNGTLILKPQYKEITFLEKYNLFKVGVEFHKYGLYDISGNQILDPSYRDIIFLDYHNLIMVCSDKNKKGLFDINGKNIIYPKFDDIAIENNENDFFVKVKNNDRYGLYSISGKEILASEFEDCGFVSENIIKYKINGYWGVMMVTGKVLISTNRQYTKLDYNRTFKKFYFEKENGQKGECNANGVQTSISKPMVPTPVLNTKKNETQNHSPNVSTTSKETTRSKPVEPGLLYRGDYTVTGMGMNDYPTISIYENRLCASIECFDYKSTNSKGERVYKGTESFGAECTYYVSPSYNIRLVKSYFNPYTSSYDNVSFTVEKGMSRMPANQGGNSSAGGDSDYHGQEHNSSTNPVQPHQVTKDCPMCKGSGKCSTCNGTHRIKYQFGSGTLECPNCKPNGACSSCGGSGKKTSTKYY